jgi:hypothetical protein
MLIFAMMLLLPSLLRPADWQSGLSGRWQAEDLQAWGDRNLAVDFGPNGVWNYSGAWEPLSRLDPRKLAAWGDGQLVIDFGADGLWTYDGRSWTKITR